MRNTMLQSLVCASLLTLCSCRNSPTEKTYINQSNASEKLILRSSSSAYWGLFNATHDEMKASSGTYTLETPSGTSSGTYTFAVRNNRKPSYIFQPKDGKSWGVELDGDNSFKDDRGVWKPKDAHGRNGA